jgi:hypothetical protein
VIASVAVATPAPTTGYVGKGQIVLRTTLGGSQTFTVGGTIALEARDARLRLDVLSLGLPGADPATSALFGTQLFPPGGFTVVYDRTASTYTVWSGARRAYYTSANAAAGASANAAPANAAIGAAQQIFGAFAFAKTLHDARAFAMSVSLSGHSVVDGHPATGLDFQLTRTQRDGAALDVHGNLELADDLDDVPVQMTASAKTPSLPESAFKLDLTTLARGNPADADFTVPSGFTRATSLGDVIGRQLPT